MMPWTNRSLRCAPLLAAVLSVAGASVAKAQTAEEAYGPRLVHLSIVETDTGVTKKVYYHGRRYFIAARSGEPYVLRAENLTDGRVEVVISVDGVNIESGDTANVNQSGFMLKPHQAFDFHGWRKSHDAVAQFRFAPLAQSYAARTGRPNNVGVIGLAVFREKVAPPAPPPPPPPPPPVSAPPPPVQAYSQQPLQMSVPLARNAPSPLPLPPPPAPISGPPPAVSVSIAPAAIVAVARSEKLGTAHGELVQEYTIPVSFERLTVRPEELRLVEYDSGENLVAAGVIPASELESPKPQAFPGAADGQHFVPDPPR